MPKMKSHSGAKKRFSTTGKGKIRYQKGNRRHLLQTKNAKRQRRLRNTGYLESTREKRVKQMLPHL
ncbi:MAG: 50S ribosomal protein L35 [Synergistales bacterium]|nr:50S ribosomal protein L35 [Synergistales bacterium]